MAKAKGTTKGAKGKRPAVSAAAATGLVVRTPAKAKGKAAAVEISPTVMKIAAQGVAFVERQLKGYDTRRLALQLHAAWTADVSVWAPPRRAVCVNVKVPGGSASGGVQTIALPSISWFPTGVGAAGGYWRCPSDPTLAEVLATPEVQQMLCAASAIARGNELQAACAFIATHEPVPLYIKGHRLHPGATMDQEWFSREFVEFLESADEAVVAHCAWGLFDWLRRTKQVSGRNTPTGAGMFARAWLGQFRAEQALQALKAWI